MAFNSSEAVMNNRFIKMFWHSDKGNVKHRLGGGPGSGGFGPGKLSKTISNDLNLEEVIIFAWFEIQLILTRWTLKKPRN